MAQSATLDTVLEQAELAAGRIHRRDRLRGRRFVQRVWMGEFDSLEEALAAAEEELRPRAVDWPALFEFLKFILPLILQIIAVL